MTPEDIAEAKLWACHARKVLRLGPDQYAVLDQTEVLYIGPWSACEAYVLTGEALWDEAMLAFDFIARKPSQLLLELGLAQAPPHVQGITRRA